MSNIDEECSSEDGETVSVKTDATHTSKTEFDYKPDKYITDSNQYKVYEEYSCTLERKDLTNKFYILQLLQKDDYFYLFSRWGSKVILLILKV
jgi:hypothetical protein